MHATLPAVHRVRQAYRDDSIADIRGTVIREVERIAAERKITPGMRIAVTAGSRGIANIDTVIAAAVGALKAHGARPFLIPAMGSHGGATPEGQRELLAGYGITEESMGVPIDARMETEVIGERDGVKCHTALAGAESDGVFIVGRVKPHTSFVGAIESGLLKMMTVGLGKQNGAAEIHSHELTKGMERTIRAIAGEVLAQNRIWGALGLVENAYHKIAMIEGFTPESIIAGDERLLREAKAFMPGLPFPELDFVWCRWMGKNISGSGIDPNIVGKHPTGYRFRDLPREGMPAIKQLLLTDLTDQSHGNAIGLGFGDAATERLVGKMDLEVSRMNAATSGALELIEPPATYPDDAAMLTATLDRCDRTAATVAGVFLESTLQLETFWATPALLRSGNLPSNLTVDPTEVALPFDGGGMLAFDF